MSARSRPRPGTRGCATRTSGILTGVGPPAYPYLVGHGKPDWREWSAIAREAACRVLAEHDQRRAFDVWQLPVRVTLAVEVPFGGSAYGQEPFHRETVRSCDPVT